MINAEQLIRKLIKQNKTIALAESFTGGLLSDEFVKVPGASKVFLGSIVAYSSDIKTSILGVDKTIINQYSVISAQVVEQMAHNVSKIMKSDIALATTGVAGPDKQDGKPVGTIFIALSSQDKIIVKQYTIETKLRQNIRRQGVRLTLELLSNYVV
ncbi:MAG: CinA family protein [Bifidobacteriaceae bacterium]|nr:CinA family protein [Bifidobacteriaceae bacterium]